MCMRVRVRVFLQVCLRIVQSSQNAMRTNLMDKDWNFQVRSCSSPRLCARTCMCVCLSVCVCVW